MNIQTLNMRRILLRSIGASAALSMSLLSITASAASLTIVSTPTEVSGPFRHNVFHAASGSGGASGSIYAWLNLDTTGPASTWDSTTGALTLYLDVFSDQAQTTKVGSAIGTSVNLDSANMNTTGNQDGGIIGNISWDFDAGALAHMQGNDGDILNNTSQVFIDDNYATSTAGYQANTYDNGFVTLWGADTDALIDSGPSFTTGTTFGTDLVFQVVPVPAAVWLFGSSLGLLGWMRRRAHTA
jgi:hypothetical protein